MQLDLRQHLHQLGFSTIWYTLGAVYLVSDIQMLGWLTDDHTTGLYNTATRLTKMTLALLGCMAGILMPRLANCLERGNRQEYERLCNLSFRFIWIFGLPAAIGILLLAPDLIQALAGQRFLPAATIIRWMTPLILLVAMRDFVASNVLYPHHQERKMFLITLVGAILLPTLGILLIPNSSNPPITMVCIILGIELFNVAGLFFLARRFMHFDWGSRGNRLALLNTAIMAGAVLAVHSCLACLPISSSLTLAAAIRLCGTLLAGAGTYIGLLLWQKDPLLLVALRPYWRRWQELTGNQDESP